jgi:hypothetical protein
MDGLCGHRQHGGGESAAECGLDEGASIEGDVWNQAVDFGLQHAALLE